MTPKQVQTAFTKADEVAGYTKSEETSCQGVMTPTPSDNGSRDQNFPNVEICVVLII